MDKPASELLRPLSSYQGQSLLLAVSGGADSVGLFRALLAVGAKLQVGHFDHALRPESAADANWVWELCQTWGIPFFSKRVEVKTVAQKRGWNLEEAARRLRYQFLSQTAKAQGLDHIATAHTLRDQAETVLINLLRGEAVLQGIATQRGPLLRPWLMITRGQIEQYLQDLGQDWREDSSNYDTHYTRAWLRAEIMPRLQARYPKLEWQLAQIAAWQTQDEAALMQLAGQIQPHTPLVGKELAVLRRHAKSQLQQHKLSWRAEHLEQLAHSLQAGQTLRLTLPQDKQIELTKGKFSQPVEWSRPDFIPPSNWQLRHYQPADSLQLSGGKRKLSDVLAEAAIPHQQRKLAPVLAIDSSVQWLGLPVPLWAVGARQQVGATEHPLALGMREALRLAKQAASQGEVPIGAVVLRGSDIIGRGHNTCQQQRDMTRHAELAALRQASKQLQSSYLNDCTLLVTLEPCPMCLGAALESRVGAIVYGASNPKAGALGGVTDLLGQHWTHRPAVQGGFWARECSKLLSEWFTSLRTEAG